MDLRSRRADEPPHSGDLTADGIHLLHRVGAVELHREGRYPGVVRPDGTALLRASLIPPAWLVMTPLACDPDATRK